MKVCEINDMEDEEPHVGQGKYHLLSTKDAASWSEELPVIGSIQFIQVWHQYGQVQIVAHSPSASSQHENRGGV